MPLYEYECSQCGHRFELIQRFADPPAETCVACGQRPVHKLISAPAVHFKGTGWYVTDYANKKSDGSPKTDAGKPGAGGKEEGTPSSSPAASPASSAATGETKSASGGDTKPAQDSSK